MLKKLVLSCLVGALLFGSANLQAEEKGKVSQDTLKAIGLGGAKVMSDKASNRIRATLAIVWGRSGAGVEGGSWLGGGEAWSENGYFGIGHRFAGGANGSSAKQSQGGGGRIGRHNFGGGWSQSASGRGYSVVLTR